MRRVAGKEGETMLLLAVRWGLLLKHNATHDALNPIQLTDDVVKQLNMPENCPELSTYSEAMQEYCS